MNRFASRLAALLLLVPGLPAQEDEGRRRYAAGRYLEAAQAWGEAVAAAPEDPRLRYDRALALWRAGRGREAVVEAEQAAALGGERFAPLRDALVGAVHYDRARAQRAAGDLERAGEHARRAAALLQRAALRSGPAVARNFERAVRLLDDIEEQRRQRAPGPSPAEEGDGQGEGREPRPPDAGDPSGGYTPPDEPEQGEPRGVPRPPEQEHRERERVETPETREAPAPEGGDGPPDDFEPGEAGALPEGTAPDRRTPSGSAAVQPLSADERRWVLDVLERFERSRRALRRKQQRRRTGVRDW